MDKEFNFPTAEERINGAKSIIREIYERWWQEKEITRFDKAEYYSALSEYRFFVNVEGLTEKEKKRVAKKQITSIDQEQHYLFYSLD